MKNPGILSLVLRKIREETPRTFVSRITDRALMAATYARVVISGYRIRTDGMTFKADRGLMGIPAIVNLARGRHEHAERELVRDFLPLDLPVVELGGCCGVVSCDLNRSLVDRGEHVVLEANPRAVQLLKVNKSLNAAEFTVVFGLLGYDDQARLFLTGDLVSSSKYRESGSPIAVSLTTLEELIRPYAPRPVSLVCDIEGSEIDLLEHEAELMSTRVAWAVIEIHEHVVGVDRCVWMLAQLRKCGFEKVGQVGQVACFANRRFVDSSCINRSIAELSQSDKYKT